MSNVELNKFDPKQWYVSNFEVFEDSLDGRREAPFHELRRTAIQRFSELGFPTARDEEWKYTSVEPLLEHRFQLASKAVEVTHDDVKRFTYDGANTNLFVFINGRYAEELSRFDAKARGVVVASLDELLSQGSEMVTKYLGRVASFEDETFTALNTAFTRDGVVVYIPEGTIIEEPLHFLNLSDGREEEFVCHPRNLYVIGKGSQVRIIDSFHSLSESRYFNNIVNEVVIGEEAVFDHVKIQEESKQSFHINRTKVLQGGRSVYNHTNIDLGGRLVRNNNTFEFEDEHGEAHLHGFYLASGKQHIDNHTVIDHAKPHCFSNELFKGILGGKAKAVFNGKILVRPHAQKTNALQSNKTLLLTNDASINAKPQLEIFADDVRCTHGATIGQIDEEARFYLKSRGIGEKMAEAMLRFAFAGDVFENIRIEPVRKSLDTKLIELLKHVEEY